MANQNRNGRPEYPEIGEELRKARRARGLSLRGLAERLGVSPSLISQIERGLANPSVSTLYAIVTELDVSLDELLFDERRRPAALGEPAPAIPDTAGDAIVPGFPVQRAARRMRFRLASGVLWERLTTVSEPGVEFLHVVYEVGGASSAEDAYQRHSGHEWGYVMSGELQVTIGFEEYMLQPGDAVSFDSSIPHRLANVGDVPVYAIWFVAGRLPVDPRVDNGQAPDWADEAHRARHAPHQV
jgi:transcriptional regulator with XRE-family HTH domain